MAQPHKGEREQIKCHMHVEVCTVLKSRFAAGEASSVSQLCADLLAMAVGLPGAVMELDQGGMLPLTVVPQPAGTAPGPDVWQKFKFRVHVAVHAELKRRVAAGAASTVSKLAADLLAVAVDRPDLVRELGRTRSEEELPLAV